MEFDRTTLVIHGMPVAKAAGFIRRVLPGGAVEIDVNLVTDVGRSQTS